MRAWLMLAVAMGVLLAIGGLLVSATVVDVSDNESHALKVMHVSPHVLSGPTPQGYAAMRALARAGVRTVVSVDGARPDVEAAERVGLKYVHLPIGYDGVPASAIAGLTRVIRERPLPVYVHCHHGQHRGPAAAVVCAMIEGALDHEQAAAVLRAAGTSPSYPGLWRSAEEFEPLPADAPLPDLVPVRDVEPMVDAMVRIDQRKDEVKALLEPDPHHSPGSGGQKELMSAAELLSQELREAARLLVADHPAEFARLMQTAARQSTSLAQEIETDPSAARTQLAELRDTCNECHERYRN